MTGGGGGECGAANSAAAAASACDRQRDPPPLPAAAATPAAVKVHFVCHPRGAGGGQRRGLGPHPAGAQRRGLGGRHHHRPAPPRRWLPPPALPALAAATPLHMRLPDAAQPPSSRGSPRRQSSHCPAPRHHPRPTFSRWWGGQRPALPFPLHPPLSPAASGRAHPPPWSPYPTPCSTKHIAG